MCFNNCVWEYGVERLYVLDKINFLGEKKNKGRRKLWEENFDDLLCFFEFPFEIKRFIYTTNQLEKLFEEVKRGLKVMEILSDEENVEKILFLIFF
uniref:Mutator family transposase n=1 Tax=Thermodesulfobacterium geofontis TaxID=1295609 RepID=A0A7V6CDV5_9BACT